MFLRIFNLIALVSLAFPVAAAAAPGGRSMSVCEFVKHVTGLKGRKVSVRGVLKLFDTSPDGATPEYLIAECPNLKQGTVTVRVKIDYPDAWFLKNPPKGFRVDKHSFVQAQQAIMSTLKDGKVTDQYIATVTGRAYTSPSPSAAPPGLHVTPEGSYEARLIIEGIYDVKIPTQ